ncbi:ABC transporter [Apiospora hydei]|uniref:ABC transporter n=1 Tax=Apiospora hydei TaxID=1337664 RepID=A0ABR1VHU7_9PEZI
MRTFEHVREQSTYVKSLLKIQDTGYKRSPSAGSRSSAYNNRRDDGCYLGIYATFQVLALFLLALFSEFTLTSLAVRAGTSLHQVLLNAMVWAPQSFFSAVDTGVTTNRFPLDIIFAGGDEPMSLLETLSAGLVALVQMILIAVAAPYEPFFFDSTVAANLDPTGACSEEVLCAALDKVRMGKMVEDAGGLRAATTLVNRSQGQKQLLALARAILELGKMVLMDEMTSSVDQHTANRMNQVIREGFDIVTVIAAAHQLNKILDFDVALVMDGGRIAEMGSPTNLQKTKSLLKDLWYIW